MLHQLESIIGAEPTMAFLRIFAQKYEQGSATSEDFIKTFKDFSGSNLKGVDQSKI